ncbi:MULTISPECIES: hypothetical protein [Streptomyces]|uniref:hypothetical protein n=1 Tax=Streptomyces TaxID=1883 RepID=UPI0001D06F38|nr:MULTISPECIES: hypothetical protein [Streptomyces]EFF90847.1 hypothetical protein SSTG_01165 [Streptomyces sp. e14]MBY8869096.1 hypothetical protein [Streptomyces sennicomposti]MYX42215.1 hypothetical protein [Streptomyces sp. SID89]NED71443.1 hypothetical protein [Streptomyces sp. SID9944]
MTSIGLAMLAMVSISASASAAEQGDNTSRQPLRTVEVTVNEYTETKTVVDGKVTESKDSAIPSATHFFSPQAPDYRGDSAYGHFTGQVHYYDPHMTFAWSLKLHPSVAASATGVMTERATATRNGRTFGYADSHPALAANYLVHSSFRVDTSHYKLTVDEHFRSGRSTKYITTVFDFIVTLI